MVAGYSVLPTETKEQLNQAVADAIRGGVDAIRGKLEGFLISIGPGPVISNGDGGTEPSLVDNKGKEHIPDGDETGGGHRAGTGTKGKSEFPSNWSDEKILGEISDVATDPASKQRPSGTGTISIGTRDGVEIKTVSEPGRIVTGYLTNTPKNE